MPVYIGDIGDKSHDEAVQISQEAFERALVSYFRGV
jgi:hypothetical protein